MKPISLQRLFELRHALRLKERLSVGRLFFWQGEPGLCDASGCLWPVKFASVAQGQRVSANDVILFACRSVAQTSQESSFPRQNDDLLLISDVREHVPCLEPWQNTVIRAPVPSDKELAESFQGSPLGTRYMSSHVKKRVRCLLDYQNARQRTSRFFINRGFLEIQTPTLVPSGGMEVYLSSFATEYEDHRGKKWVLQLPTSPEFALKKILAEGVERVFQISRSYRNRGELSRLHEPEFTMLEWYRVGASLTAMQEDTRQLVLHLARSLGSPVAAEIPTLWPVYRVDALFREHLGLDLEALQDTQLFYQAAKEQSPSVTQDDGWDTLFFKLFMEKIEPFLQRQRACFVSHYPIQAGGLAAKEAGKPYAERCEAFLFGVEICNAYLELSDSKALKNRLREAMRQNPGVRQDPVFENAMNYGLPPCAGNALGLERVVSLLLGLPNISSLFALPFFSQFPSQTIAWD